MPNEFDLDTLVEEAALEGQLEAGGDPRVLIARGGDPRYAAVNAAATETANSLPWTDEEDDFLRDHLGWLSEKDIAERLGRTLVAVRLRWKRDLRLTPPSKRHMWPTLNQVADILVKDAKSVARLANRGILPGIRDLPLRPDYDGMRAMHRTALYRFATIPHNWIYFDPDRLARESPDRHLAALVAQRRKVWDDDWWTPRQVAAYHGVRHTDVNRYANAGKIDGVQWGNWWFLRSEATRDDLVFYKGKGCAEAYEADWRSEDAEAFLVLGRAVGLSVPDLDAMAGWQRRRARHILRKLHADGKVPMLVRDHDLPVRYDTDTGALWADWRTSAHRRRFFRLAAACERFAARESLSYREKMYVAGVMQTWAAWFAPDAAGRDLARRMKYWCRMTIETLDAGRRNLAAWGADPFEKTR